MQNMKVGILGSGDVGKSLARGFSSLGHEVKIGSRSPEKLNDFVSEMGGRVSSGTLEQAARYGDLIALATLGTANEEAIRLGGVANFDGKVVLDATNPLTFEPGKPPRLFVGFDDSLGERVQRQIPNARVVKCFNTAGNTTFYQPKYAGGSPDMFLAGNDSDAKKIARQVCEHFGWGAIDLGGIEAARYTEPMCLAWVMHGVLTGSWGHAFKMLTS